MSDNQTKPPTDYDSELWNLHIALRGIALELSNVQGSRSPVTTCMVQAVWRCVDKLDGIAEHYVSDDHKKYGGGM